MNKRRLFLSLTLLLSLTVVSCDLFHTREPEPPTKGGSSYLPPTSPQRVLQNLTNAVKERNTDSYVRCLADSLTSPRTFRFIPTEQSAAQYYGVFSSWSLRNERQYFDNLKSHMSPSAVPGLTLSRETFEYISGDSAIYDAGYVLFIPHDVTGVPQTIRGNLHLTMGLDRNNMWMIYQWIDLSSGSEYSWSDLKGRFSY